MPTLDITLETLSQRTGSSSGALETTQERILFQDAVRVDVAAMIGQMNAVYFPLFDTLSKVVGLDALDFGLSGNVIFSHVNATAADATLYWDSTTSRARTIKESFDVMLSEISRLENDIDNNASLIVYDDTAVVATGAANTANLSQLRLDAMGDQYIFGNDGAADLTYSLSQAIDSIGAFFSGFPGTGNTYTPVYPALALAINVSDLNFDVTIAQANITDLPTHLSAIRTFVGMDNAADTAPVYGSNTIVTDATSLETAIGALDAAISFITTANVTSNSAGTLGTDDFVFGSDQLDDDGDATHDNRFLFDKSTAAFRAGVATGTQWDTRGAGSFAGGTDNTATGANSVAFGQNNTNAGGNSSILGGGGIGILANSIALGALGSVIAAGAGNSTGSDYTLIGSGLVNAIDASSDYAAILAGASGSITTSEHALIGTGAGHTISGSAGSSILSGNANTIALSTNAFIGGGSSNDIGSVGISNNAFIGGGSLNLIGTVGACIGALVAGGAGNVISTGSYAAILGGADNTVSASYGVASGLKASVANYGVRGHASGSFATDGDAQTETAIWRGQTTDATITEIFLDGSALQYIIDDDSTYALQAWCVARQTGGAAGAPGDSLFFDVKVALERTAGVAVGVNGVGGDGLIAETNPATPWVFTFDVDVPTSALRIQVTGEASKDINWVVTAKLVKVSG